MAFLLEEGVWLGEGQIELCQYAQQLTYYTKWKIGPLVDGKIDAIQEVEIADGHERVINRYSFFKTEAHSFQIELENELFGKVSGKGIISTGAIAWEFHGEDLIFEGFELFQLKNDGTYINRAEYATDGEPHSIISGTLWKK
ncbi:MAG: hypothetical protein P4L16_08065 [Chlamydiales bacterium]|nr:hypothetical protein [Chlamydiales bacterium]